eukprot:TRINITY_DN2311_c0_g1_i2.p1 TRINITY_DN2311_c0_g1~~TRINITY_DN2311_c0_g1_i2.p1  ORF type:complete len:950 (-),score=94.90 TRINITY_DN2311_c0_g1_i2:1307-4156(-)
MQTRRYSALYTKHKIQKRKTWQDGTLVWDPARRKVVLYSEEDAGRSAIASYSSPTLAQPPQPGDSYETDTFLIEVNEMLVDKVAVSVPTAATAVASPVALLPTSRRPNSFKVPFKVRSGGVSQPAEVEGGEDGTFSSLASMPPPSKRRKLEALPVAPSHGDTRVLHSPFTVEHHDPLAQELLELVSSPSVNHRNSRSLPSSTLAEYSTLDLFPAIPHGTIPTAALNEPLSSRFPALADLAPKKLSRRTNETQSRKLLNSQRKVPPQPRCTLWPPVHDFICFPSHSECLKLPTTQIRCVDVPFEFESLAQYQNVLSRAIIEEINLRVLPLARKYHEVSQSLHALKGPSKQASFRSRGIRMYLTTPLQKSEFSSGFHSKEGREMKHVQIFLTIASESREHYSSYARDDLWVIMCDDDTRINQVAFLARSVYHGPNSAGSIELAPLEIASGSIPKSASCTAVNLGNFASEFSELDLIASMDTNSCPLLAYLLRRCPSSEPLLQAQAHTISALFRDICGTFNLNADQSVVLSRCLSWFGDQERPDPIQLVHGAFGSGKSTMLVAIILALVKLLENIDPKCTIRILFTAATNVAVDRVLLGLQQNQFQGFLRFGSAKRISKDLAANGGVDTSEGSSSTNSTVSTSKLRATRVVGTTCLASLLPIMDDQTFAITIIDEMSQVTEPLSLLPIVRSGCSRLLIVGDPKQLPPQLSHQSAHPFGLEKTLYARLEHIGYPVTSLRTQYRLHPTLSFLPNKLFYNGTLLDGCTAADRAPLHPDLPTLLVCDTQSLSERERYEHGSVFNLFEAEIVVHGFVRRLVCDYHIPGISIGVICLYQAQKAKVVALMEELNSASDTARFKEELDAVQISTVDAFQGAEKHVIILATTKTSRSSFLESDTRLNVALTRAKNHLFIACHVPALTAAPSWKQIIAHARSTAGGFVSGTNFQRTGFRNQK